MKEFKFTDEQQQVVDFILEQVKLGREGQNVLVSGRGGVGKTSMVCELICILLKKNYKVACGAMTGKATGVLRQKIYENLENSGINIDMDDEENTDKEMLANLRVDTVSKLTKKAQVVGLKDSGETVYVNKWIDPTDFKFDVLIIDELSMVPNYIQQWWAKTSCRVIGLGDYCQIPEVHGADTIKEVSGFRHDLKLPPSKLVNGYGVKVLRGMSTFELTEVLRSTGDITRLCNDLRDFTLPKGKVVETIKDWANKSEDIIYSQDINDIETGLDWQIIAYTNNMCAMINDALAIGDEFPDGKDKIILHDNINPVQSYNGEVYVFNDLLKRIDDFKKKTGDSMFVVWKFNKKMPDKNSKSEIEKQSHLNWVNYRIAAKDIHKKRMGMLPSIINGIPFLKANQKQDYIDAIRNFQKTYANEETCFNYIIERLDSVDREVSRYIMAQVPNLPRVYFVNIALGYCCTTHKAQGSEYPKVCYIYERMDRPLLYTGVSRAKSKLKVIDLT